MQPDDEPGAETAESERREPPLLRRPEGRTRWLAFAALFAAAVFAVWRCG